MKTDILYKEDWQNAIDATKRWKDEWRSSAVGLQKYDKEKQGYMCSFQEALDSG